MLVSIQQKIQKNYCNTFSAEWDKNFYDYLQSDPRHQEHKKQLEGILNSIDWKNIILTSKVFLKWFQLMLTHYKKAKHPYDMSLTWSGFPGYLILIKYLLLEIKHSNQYPYPETIKIQNYVLPFKNIQTKDYEFSTFLTAISQPLLIIYFGLIFLFY